MPDPPLRHTHSSSAISPGVPLPRMRRGGGQAGADASWPPGLGSGSPQLLFVFYPPSPVNLKRPEAFARGGEGRRFVVQAVLCLREGVLTRWRFCESLKINSEGWKASPHPQQGLLCNRVPSPPGFKAPKECRRGKTIKKKKKAKGVSLSPLSSSSPCGSLCPRRGDKSGGIRGGGSRRRRGGRCLAGVGAPRSRTPR